MIPKKKNSILLDTGVGEKESQHKSVGGVCFKRVCERDRAEWHFSGVGEGQKD
jgi:hypothetical protein